MNRHNELKAARKQKVDDLRDAILKNDIKSIEEASTWLDAADRLHQQARERLIRRLSLIVIVATVAVTLLLGMLRIGTADVVYNISVSGVDIDLLNKSGLPGFHNISQINVSNVRSVLSTGLFQSYDTTARTELSVTGGSTSFSPVNLDSLSVVRISHGVGLTRIECVRTPLYADIVATKGAVLTFDTITENRVKNETQVLHLAASDESTVVALTSDSLIVGGPIQFLASDVRFEEKLETETFTSTIYGGKIKFLDLDEEFILDPGEYLHSTFSGPAVVKLSLNRKAIDITIKSEASKIEIGEEEFKRDVMPTYLEYIYYHQKLIVLWSAVALVCSFAWAVINFFKND